MKNTKKNAFYAQSGGVTSVINASACGVIESARKNKKFIHKLYAGKNGILGALNQELIDTSYESKAAVENLKYTPGGIFGSCRYKLEDFKKNSKDYEKLLKVFIAHNIGYFFYNGGGDSQDTTNKISQFCSSKGFDIKCIGIPKTVDNDVFPVSQTLGAWTAAEQGAIFFENIVNENTTSTRQLIIHEVMGRHCGWLTAKTAKDYRERLKNKVFLPELMVKKSKWDIDAIYIPEQDFNFQNEVDRLRSLMDEKDNINIFLSEGAGQDAIVREMEESGKKVPRDAFGHVRLDEINPGQWFAKQFSSALKAEKTLVQKSGYFARSAKANAQDLELIKRSAFFAAEQGLNGKSGLAGLDEDHNNQLRLIEFERIKGGKPFDISLDWFQTMTKEIGQQ